jgi:hypothetical protein
MKTPATSKISKDQLQKLILSSIGLVVLIYIYFSFFLGPLNKSRASMEKSIADLQVKLGSSKGEMAKAARLESEAKAATARFEAFKALSPEGAPIAWFPPRIKLFFANHQIDKATARLDNATAYKEPDLADWAKHSWAIDLPQTDFVTLGQALADLENSEPLLSISKINIKAGTEDPQFQVVSLSVNTAIMKR